MLLREYLQVMQVMQAMQVIKVLQVMQVEQIEQVMQVIQENLFRDHFWWRHLVAKFATYASSTIWWLNLQIMQVVPLGGRIWNQCKWHSFY